MRDNPYKNIEKFIDPSKISADFLPDIEDDDVGKVLYVNNDLEGEWINVKKVLGDIDFESFLTIDDISGILVSIKEIQNELNDKIGKGDFEGALESISVIATSLEILSGKIEAVVEESKVTGAYVPGNNTIPTTVWRNMLDPSEFLSLNSFTFAGSSGWIGNDDNTSLLLSGDQTLTINKPKSIGASPANISIDVLAKVSSLDECELLDGIYISKDGKISINSEHFVVTTNTSVPVNDVFHLNVSIKGGNINIYLNSELIESNIISGSGYVVKDVMTFLRGMSGEIFNIKIYNKAISKHDVLKNYEAWNKTEKACYFYLASLFNAGKAECVYSDIESVRAAITIAKEEIKLTSSKLNSMTHLTTGHIKKIRYIRDYQGANDKTSDKRWSGIECYDSSDANILKGVTGSGSDDSFVNIDYATDPDNDDTYASSNSDGASYIEFDLGSVRDDLLFAKVFRYYKDNRTCSNTKFSVSEDGVTWINLFDSSISGEYKETRDGIIIPINIASHINNIATRLQSAEIKITPDAIISTVTDSSIYLDDQKKLHDYITKQSDMLNTEIVEVRNSLTSLDSEIKGAFKDGIINQTEAKIINDRVQQLEKEKKDLDAQFDKIYNNEKLSNETKQIISTRKNYFDSSHSSLINSILGAISDDVISTDENVEVESATVNYSEKLSLLNSALTDALNEIAKKYSQEAMANANEYTNSQIKQTSDRINIIVEKVEKIEIDTQRNRYTVSIKVERNPYRMLGVITKNEEDFTLECPKEWFIWRRQSSNIDADDAWNNSIGNSGIKYVSCSDDELHKNSVFSLIIDDGKTRLHS